MSHSYLAAAVPAAARDFAEAAIAPYLVSPTAPGYYTFGVPLSADGSGPPTHYGTCAVVGAVTLAAAGGLLALVPGAAASSPQDTTAPARFDAAGWFAGQGLQVVAADL